jgi:hypothetical protein
MARHLQKTFSWLEIGWTFQIYRRKWVLGKDSAHYAGHFCPVVWHVEVEDALFAFVFVYMAVSPTMATT